MRTAVWSSVTRILPRRPSEPTWAEVPRTAWEDGDYVVAEVEGRPAGQIEATDGHFVGLAPGDLLVGALGARRATLEAVGDWRAVGDEGRMQTLTRAGVLGQITSAASAVRPLLVGLRYLGHLTLDGAPARMSEHALPPPPEPAPVPTPAVVLIGTSMSSGKTTTARILIRRLVLMGLSVTGAKLSGVGRYADILAMRDSGAREVLDFVDAGLPSTIAPRSVVADATQRLLAAIDGAATDVLVAEAGASPLEPYQGRAVLEILHERTRLLALCASDPYAVSGALAAFDLRPDFVAGRAAATSASVALVAKLSDLDAIDVTDPEEWPRIDGIITQSFGIGSRPVER